MVGNGAGYQMPDQYKSSGAIQPRLGIAPNRPAPGFLREPSQPALQLL